MSFFKNFGTWFCYIVPRQQNFIDICSQNNLHGSPHVNMFDLAFNRMGAIFKWFLITFICMWATIEDWKSSQNTHVRGPLDTLKINIAYLRVKNATTHQITSIGERKGSYELPSCRTQWSISILDIYIYIPLKDVGVQCTTHIQNFYKPHEVLKCFYLVWGFRY